jgi:hypothetical protein
LRETLAGIERPRRFSFAPVAVFQATATNVLEIIAIVELRETPRSELPAIHTRSIPR